MIQVLDLLGEMGVVHMQSKMENVFPNDSGLVASGWMGLGNLLLEKKADSVH